MSGWRGYENAEGMRVEQVFAAAGVWNTLVWSHDGSMLAFNAAIDGPSADLYVYHTSDGSVVQLTDGLSQSVNPVFSPDDRYILQGAVESLHWGYSGAGYDYLNIWAVRSDDGGVHKLYDKEFYGYEHVLGWRTDYEYVAVSEDLWCSFSDLRVVDFHTGDSRTVFRGSHNQSAFASGWDKVLLYRLTIWAVSAAKEPWKVGCICWRLPVVIKPR